MRLLWLFQLIMVCWVSAQNKALQFRYFEPANGWLGGYVFSIGQDQQGFIWLGTRKGLTRYDGVQFKSYQNETFQQPMLANGNIRDIIEYQGTHLWLISDQGGVSIFDLRKETFTILQHDPNDPFSLGANESYAAVKDRTNQIWIAHINKGLSVYNPQTKRFKHYRHQDNVPYSLSDDYLQNIFIDRSGTIWIATRNKGICYYDPTKDGFIAIQQNVNDKNTLPSNFVNCITDDLFGNLWIGSDKGITKWDRHQNRFTTFTKEQNGIADDLQYNAKTSKDGMVFFTSKLGLSIINPKNNIVQVFQQYPDSQKQNDRSGNSFVDIFFDKDQNLWLQTNNGFVMSPYVVNEIKAYSTAASQQHNEFFNNGFSWVLEGTMIKANNTCSSKSYVFQLPISWIPFVKQSGLRFLQSKGSKQAIAIPSIGIVILDIMSGQYEILPPFLGKSLEPNAFGLGFLDSQQNFWASYHEDQLICFDHKKKSWLRFDGKDYPCKLELPYSVSEFLEDNLGQVWVASSNRALHKFNLREAKSKMYCYQIQDLFSPASRNFIAMHQDKQGHIWLAGNGDYLDLYDAKQDRFIHFNHENAFNDLIYNMGEDEIGNLWIFSKTAIVKFTPPSHINFDKAFHEDFTFIKYSNLQFMKGYDHAIDYLLQDCKGVFYFTNSSGHYALDPALFRPNSKPAMLYFTDFHLYGERINANDDLQLLKQAMPFNSSIDLDYNQNTFSISFALLSLAYASSNTYSYKLEGVDKEWQFASGLENTVHYSKLDPGKYVFILRAKNSDGTIALTERKLFIVIQSAFWQTWWFKIFLGLAIIAVLYGLYRMRINRILAQQKLRNSIARDLHDEVGSTLSSIAIMSEVVAHSVEKNTNDAKSKLLKISNNARDTLENMDDIIWAINPENDSFFNLEDRLKAYLIPLCESKQIDFSIQIDPSLEKIHVDMQRRKNMYLVLKEAINNAIKYSEASKIDFKCEIIDQHIIALVQDNGKGFDTNIVSNRNGLRNMRKRAEELNGHLSIKSQKNEGSIVILELPIR
jgi:ligand-binding sensor domain-containing protein/two-component sensor histidine kinase